MNEEALVVDAVVGICVHDPDTLVEPPRVVRDWATKALAGQIKDASLSPEAKTAFLMTQGAASFEESAKTAAADLPEQMRQFMVSSGLDPAAYDLQSFTEELRADLKILCMAAVRKQAARPVSAVPPGEPARSTPAKAPPEERVEAWAAAIKNVQGQENRWQGIGCGLGLLGIIGAALIIWLLRDNSAVGVALGVIGLVAAIVLWVEATRRSKKACDELVANILRTCEAESLSKPEIERGHVRDRLQLRQVPERVGRVPLLRTC
jgi:hypothetical protein